MTPSSLSSLLGVVAPLWSSVGVRRVLSWGRVRCVHVRGASSAGGVPPHAPVTVLTCVPPYPAEEGQEADGEAGKTAAEDGEAEDEAVPGLALHPRWMQCLVSALYSVTCCLLSLMIKSTHLATVY